MLFGYKRHSKYRLNKTVRVIMHKSGKSTKQCSEADKRANRELDMVKRTVANREKSIILKLYKALVRLHLEYCIQVWNPRLKKDIETLESAEKSNKDDYGSKKFELRGDIKKVQINKPRNKEKQRWPHGNVQDINRKRRFTTWTFLWGHQKQFHKRAWM